MVCPYCGAPLEEGMKYCPDCGKRIAELVSDASAKPAAPAQKPFVPETPSEKPVAPAPVQKPKKKSRLGLILGLAGAAIVIAAALILLLVVLPEQKRVKRYNEGVELLNDSNYTEAQEVFAALGNYADSEELLGFAERGVAYQKAVAAMKRGNYRYALDTFTKDPDFKDAQVLKNTCQAHLNLEEATVLYEQGAYEDALLILNELYKLDVEVDEEGSELADRCRRMMLFNEAKALYEQGDYQGALDMFESYPIADIDGADTIMQDCRRQLGYRTIIELMDNGSYRNALDLLYTDAGEGMPDRDARIEECGNRIAYADAEQALRNGHNYDAYIAFSALGSFADAASRANACIVSKPRTGETYHNSAYSSSSVKLTIKPPSDGTNNYLKIYALENGRETLVCCAFIRSGEKVTLKMPAGTYRIKVAYGSGDWFGETDMFGDSGVYQRLNVDGAETFKLSKGSWELQLRANITDGNVGTSTENRNSF